MRHLKVGGDMTKSHNIGKLGVLKRALAILKK
jgi:hypothetical protein